MIRHSRYDPLNYIWWNQKKNAALMLQIGQNMLFIADLFQKKKIPSCANRIAQWVCLTAGKMEPEAMNEDKNRF